MVLVSKNAIALKTAPVYTWNWIAFVMNMFYKY